MARDVFILGGKRTPMGEYVGALKDMSAIELGAIAASGALQATNVSGDEIDHTIIGNALQTSGDAIYGARHVALKAGVPFDRPALTVNRLCGSGIQSIISGAQMIQLGEARTALVGGMESMSQAPHVIRGARSGFALGQGKLEDSLMVALLDTYCNTPMAGTAENLARKYDVSREEQDKYALRSQQEAKRAGEAGIFAEEIVPMGAIDHLVVPVMASSAVRSRFPPGGRCDHGAPRRRRRGGHLARLATGRPPARPGSATVSAA